MIIKIPMWAKPIKDEGVATFLAFASRMCELHGYDTPYFMHKDDVIRILNKRSDGLEAWLRRFECIATNMKLGQVYEHVVVWSMKQPVRTEKWQRALQLSDYELTDPRQKMVWMYLLGCLNQNLISEDDYEHLETASAKYNKNSFGIKEFNITREAAGYIKILDRECEEDD
jgi:hypothetical protein